MGLRINTNVASLSAQRNMQLATNSLSRNYERLATGRRIARASDDAAGLGISARLRAQVRSLDQAARNAQDGISMLQTAEGGLVEVENALVRMRELAVQSANGTLVNGDRTNINQEFLALAATIGQISSGTTFNNTAILGTPTGITLQVGSGTSAGVDTLVYTTPNASAAALTIATLAVDTAVNATAALADLDAAINSVTSSRATIGATQNRISATIASLNARSENLSAANSRILDVDVAFETAELTKNSILQQAAISVLAQANAQPQAALSLLQ